MKKTFIFSLALLAAAPVFAEEINEENSASAIEEFISDETITTGLAYDMFESMMKAQPEAEKPVYGAKLTDHASTPKFGGYFIGKYAWNSDDAQDAKAGFSQRLIRVYVDGKILDDFTYRVQAQISNSSMHMKDFFVEWGKYKEFKVKIGQFKRAFTFENPMNPWDVGVGDYSQLTKKLAGMGDYNGESSSTGGRDQGLQFQGDLFPVGKDGHRLVHYQAMVANGQGINTADANQHKDLIGTLQIQPIKNLFIGIFGWTGNYTQAVTAAEAKYATNITVDRKRWALSAKYTWKDWVFRTEYAKSNGHKISDHKVANDMGLTYVTNVVGTGKADAFYATVGIPVVSWFNCYLKYDEYRDQGTEASRKTIYSVAPTFRLHKNLMFQLQYNYNDDKAKNAKYSELWLETYVRF